MTIWTTRNGAIMFATIMMIYSIVHMCLFIGVFFQKRAEPDWIVLFKLVCDFILLPSSILLLIAIVKVNEGQPDDNVD
ncbi:uncharacterized protein LOC106667896 isoform X2 [Cimex lectularius]|uniref:Uncharacterized protein n=1 Tax=Cimex lectularius TaxID=79782 RepID=A0A8I6RXI9_CIMLE|nr:uncharacterized protein LOC106667896 isoform X2 [Cimex lectularius]